MDAEQQKNKGKLAIFQGIGELGFGLLMMFFSAVGKESWEYYVYSDRKTLVSMVTLLAWCGIGMGIVNLVYGFLLMVAADEQQVNEVSDVKKEEPTIEYVDGEIVDKEWSSNQPQIEWIVLRQKNGVTIRAQHNIADNAEYRLGDFGRASIRDKAIIEFVSCGRNV